MKRSAFAASLTACFYLGLAAPLLPAQPAKPGTANNLSPDKAAALNEQPAQKCMSDMKAFDSQLQRGGYWVYGSGYGYGYPIYGYVYGYRPQESSTTTSNTPGTGYEARSGYEVRTLLASAHILAQQGQEQTCQAVLNTARDSYKRYEADLRNRGVRRMNVPGWRRQQIAAAQSVTKLNTSFRSDQLVGTAVRNPQDEVLGSVDDIVLNPRTGEFAYLVVARGGIFGIGKKYVPVPWEHLKTTVGVTVLVLDTSKKAMDKAPQMEKDHFSPQGRYAEMSAKLDAYWKASLSK